MNDFIVSQIRTLTPILAGGAISWATARGLELSEEFQTELIVAMTAAIQWVYYFIARTLESKFPKMGWLLGFAKKLKYTKA